MYLEYHAECLSPRPNWDPLFRKWVCPHASPGTKGGGTHSPVGEGGCPNSDDRKKPSTLSTVWFIEKLTYVQSGPDKAAGWPDL